MNLGNEELFLKQRSPPLPPRLARQFRVRGGRILIEATVSRLEEIKRRETSKRASTFSQFSTKRSIVVVRSYDFPAEEFKEKGE